MCVAGEQGGSATKRHPPPDQQTEFRNHYTHVHAAEAFTSRCADLQQVVQSDQAWAWSPKRRTYIAKTRITGDEDSQIDHIASDLGVRRAGATRVLLQLGMAAYLLAKSAR